MPADGPPSISTVDSQPSISLDKAAWPRREAQPQAASQQQYPQRQQQQPSQPNRLQKSPRMPSWPLRTGRTPRPLQLAHNTIPTVTDEEDVYFPLSPAPRPDRKSSDLRQARSSLASSGLLPESSLYNVNNPVVSEGPTGPPSVYWSDDGTSIANNTGDAATIRSVGTQGTIGASTNPSAFTFLREPTPPPGEDASPLDKEMRVSGSMFDNRSSIATSKGHKYNESRNTADYSFVNGRYVPPGLRNGRPPGRIPVMTDREKEIAAAAAAAAAAGRGSAARDHFGRGGGGGGVGGNGSEYTDDDSHRPRRRCSLWLLLLLLLGALVVVGVAVGVGVGVTMAKKNHDHARNTAATVSGGSDRSSSNNGSSSSTPAAAASATASPTSTSTSTSASATATSSTDCPAANGTVYQVPGSDVSFLRLCGVDFSGTGNAVDLSHLPTETVDDCMNNCAGTSGCTGCGWGPLSTSEVSSRDPASVWRSGRGSSSGGQDYQCWLKSTLGTSHVVREDWCFAILQ